MVGVGSGVRMVVLDKRLGSAGLAMLISVGSADVRTCSSHVLCCIPLRPDPMVLFFCLTRGIPADVKESRGSGGGGGGQRPEPTHVARQRLHQTSAHPHPVSGTGRF